MNTRAKKSLVIFPPERRKHARKSGEELAPETYVYYDNVSWMKKEKTPGIKTRIIDNLQRSMRRLQEGAGRATEILFPPRPHHKKPRK